MVQFHRPAGEDHADDQHQAPATGSTARPSQAVRIMKDMRAMKPPTMNTSPWAKFTMPMMPNTIV